MAFLVDEQRDHPGEYPETANWLVVAPMPGRFRPAIDLTEHVAAGQLIGVVARSGTEVEVHAQCDGRFMGHLADHGELVRDSQPVAWIQRTT